MFIIDKNPDRRRQIKEDIATFSARTTKYLNLYRTQIYTEEDATNFQSLIQIRASYIHVRNRVLELASQGKETEALAGFNESLLPADAQVKKAGDKLFEYNMDQGRVRGERIMRFCTITQVALAVASVVIFAVGFFLGLFK